MIILNQKNYEKLEAFHTKLFMDFLGAKTFVRENHSNKNDSYLIVPVNSSGSNTFFNLSS